MGDELINLHQDFQLNDVFLKPFSSLEHSDIVKVWQMRNHPDITRWMNSNEIISFDKHLEFILSQKKQHANFNYLAKIDGIAIGVISLHNINFKNEMAWLGIYKNPELADIPLGKILLKSICHLAFDEVQLHTLKLEVISTNLKAINAYRSAGFVQEGIKRESLKQGNKYLDMIFMGILAKEWKVHEYSSEK